LIWPRRASPWSAGLALLVPSPPRVIPYPARCRARSDERGENQVTRRQGAQTGRKGGHGVNCRNVNVSHERPAGRSQSTQAAGCGRRPRTDQVRRRVGGWLAIAFQKLFTSGIARFSMMSSYTARTSGEASACCISGTVAGSPPAAAAAAAELAAVRVQSAPSQRADGAAADGLRRAARHIARTERRDGSGSSSSLT
jgi:hypothetical protein